MPINQSGDPVDRFVVTLARIDDQLARLAKLRADHMNADPDNVNWGDVAEAERLAAALDRALEPWTTITRSPK